MLDKTKPTKPYSFEIYQALPGGMVLIDACVPASVAALMMRALVLAEQGQELLTSLT